MAKSLKGKGSDVKSLIQKGTSNIDLQEIKGKAFQAGDALKEKAGDIKDTAMDTREDIKDKLTELDQLLEKSITEYNDAYTFMNDKGVRLFVERSRAADSIGFVEDLVNSIANSPKSFAADFEEIKVNRSEFVESCEFAEREVEAARMAAGGAGAGLAAGASVAMMAPSAAMWIATTFGTASTGAAISTLSGAAATNAALAWLGGGALAAGGGGITGGTAFLALAGPVGLTIAGATLLGSIVVFAGKRAKLNKQKNEEIEDVKNNTEAIKETDAKINEILTTTADVRDGLNKEYSECMKYYGSDYLSLNDEQKMLLGTLVNNTKALSVMFTKKVED
jgi:uncharacterized membrane-anchored protein YhcB (DUF1043 family)